MNELTRLLREIDAGTHSCKEQMRAALALAEKGEVVNQAFYEDRSGTGNHFSSVPCLVIPLSRPVEVEERHRGWARAVVGSWYDKGGSKLMGRKDGAEAIEAAARKLAELESELEQERDK